MPPNNSNISVTVTGDFTLDDIEDALKAHFTGKSIRVDRGNGDAGNGNNSNGNQLKKSFNESKENDNPKEIVVSYSPTADQLQYLKVLLERKTKDMKEMEASSSKALLTMQTFQTQQKALLDEFIILHQKYDEQKQALVDILWVDCAKHDPTLKFIPVLQNMNSFVETDNSVGIYNMGEELGSGQFAAVRTCWVGKNQDTEYAIKIIKKDRMTTHLSVSRLSDEVGLLLKLQNQYVISIKETFQTQKHMYIITEKGGADMFEFFDEHDDGVPEPWAKDIMACVLISVQACHDAGICHRDLKPENILLTFDYKKHEIVDLKLCDFGLGAYFEPKVQLTDFCGSPGFFCPEMITQGTYYGDKSDVWSIGGIMLELILGNERFTECWMGAYEYEVLQSRERFAREIDQTVKKLPSKLPGTFHSELKDFIMQFLKMKPTERPTVESMCDHPWVASSVVKMRAQLK